MSAYQPFKIDIQQSSIDRLKQKLSLAEFPDELDDAGWDLGSPLGDIKRLTKAWENWDWRQAEKKLNEYPQFHTGVQVDGFGNLDIHFVYKQSEAPDAIPLLFVHGWPGSFVEVFKILPLLTKAEGNVPSFHVIAPSLPNYGFSQGVSKRGFALAQYAETCHKLMFRLGYKIYVTQAGDWGYWITRAIGRLYPESCKASHFNMVWANSPNGRSPSEALEDKSHSKDVREGLERTEWFEQEGRGYNLEQSTKPQTLAYALNDSPVALLAWIYEKLHDWTDNYPWTDEEIFTWVSIYQFSRAGPGAAHRIYYEVTHTDPKKEPNPEKICTYVSIREFNPKVPLGLTYNPKDLFVAPSSWGQTLGPVVYEVRNERGGHFYTHEYPDLLVRDLRKMFEKGGGVFGITASAK